MVKEKLADDLQKVTEATAYLMTPTASDHIFQNKTRGLLEENSNDVYFRNLTYPIHTYDNYGNLIPLPLNPTPGTYEYNLKCDIVEAHLNDVSLYVEKLYDITSPDIVYLCSSYHQFSLLI